MIIYRARLVFFNKSLVLYIFAIIKYVIFIHTGLKL